MGKKKEKKSAPSLAAVIDIGSNSLRLKIGEQSKTKIKTLEDLRYPLALGRDTFTIGKISVEKEDLACNVLNKFIAAMDSYGINNVRAVATTAVREASNRDYFLDKIKIKTGLSVHVLDDWEEKNYIYRRMLQLIYKSETHNSTGVMVYIGSGNLGIAVCDDGKIPFSQTLHVGSLRLTEILEHIQEYTNEFYKVVEEYLNGFTDALTAVLPQKSYSNFFSCGHEILMIAKLCNASPDGDFIVIPCDDFYALYDAVKTKTVDQLMEEFDLQEDRAELIIPSLCIYRFMLQCTGADKIVIPIVFMPDEVLHEMLYPDQAVAISKDFEQSTLLSARTLGARYMCEHSHSEQVAEFSLQIFDKLKKIHNCGARERLLLHVSAILHDIGKFINLKGHYNHSYSIISGSDIIGLSSLEKETIACIAKYHSRLSPDINDPVFTQFSPSNRVLISKLASILRIADSLNRSHNAKFDDIDVKVTDNTLVIYINTYMNTKIEEWSFENKSLLFKEVFGMDAIIKKKKVYTQL